MEYSCSGPRFIKSGADKGCLALPRFCLSVPLSQSYWCHGVICPEEISIRPYLTPTHYTPVFSLSTNAGPSPFYLFYVGTLTLWLLVEVSQMLIIVLVMVVMMAVMMAVMMRVYMWPGVGVGGD